ncbi:MAG: tetratricopeptide repeat protein [Myxococcales bacterium]|nr:tetratricopeptide repeat protein [Myxococcales bacterium]
MWMVGVHGRAWLWPSPSGTTRLMSTLSHHRSWKASARLAVLSGLLLAGLLATVGACTSPPVDLSYAGSARAAYDEAMEAFEDEDYPEAVRLFSVVKNKFAYSQFAAMAELRIADSHYAQDKWAEAIDAYRSFAQNRPNHPEVPFALWRIADSYYEQIPSDFIIFPPAFEKDQAPTKDALRALQSYVEHHPTHKNASEANERIRACRELLADYELYVAGFYLNEERPESARARLEKVVAEYGDLVGRWCEAALKLARVYATQGKADEARATALKLIAAHPTRGEAEDARLLIAELH